MPTYRYFSRPSSCAISRRLLYGTRFGGPHKLFDVEAFEPFDIVERPIFGDKVLLCAKKLLVDRLIQLAPNLLQVIRCVVDHSRDWFIHAVNTRRKNIKASSKCMYALRLLLRKSVRESRMLNIRWRDILALSAAVCLAPLDRGHVGK